MKRIIRKWLALLSAVAIVVSSLTVQTAKVSAEDYSKLTYTQVGETTYYVAAGNDEFPFQRIENQENQMLIIPQVNEGTKPIWADFTDVTLNGVPFKQVAGAGIYIQYSELKDNAYNVYEGTSSVDNHRFQIIIKAGTPQEAGSATVKPVTNLALSDNNLLTWTAPDGGADSYTIKFGKSGAITELATGVTETQYDMASVIAGVTEYGKYYILVFAVKGTDVSSAASITYNYEDPTPAAPTGLVANIDDLNENYTISWGNVSGADSYKLYVDDVLVGKWGNGDVYNIAKHNMEAGKQYTFAVTAVKNGRESVKATVVVTTPIKGSKPSDSINTDKNLVNTTTPVVASSEADAGFKKEFIRDRNFTTRWAAGRENDMTRAGEYIYVDLGNVYDLTKVTLVWDYLPTDGYKIYTATDVTGDTTTIGKLDTDVWTEATKEAITNSTTGVGGVDIELQSSGRYVMVYMLSGTKDWGVSIMEIGVFGTETTAVIPNAPTSVAIDASANLTWAAAANANSYKIYVDDEYVATVEADARSYSLATYFEDKAEKEYKVSISSLGTAGESSKAEVTYTKKTQQAAPEGFEAKLIDGDTAVQITWTSPNTDSVLYIDGVLYDNGVNGQIKKDSRVEVTDTLKLKTKLTAGAHTFAIAAMTQDQFGQSLQTDAQTLIIPQTVPIEVENLKVTDGIGKITVTFQESSTAKNAGEIYNIYIDNELKSEGVGQGEHEYNNVGVGLHQVKVTAKILNNAEGHTSEYIESAGVTSSGTVYEIGDPTNVTATGGTNSIDVTWEDSITTSSYCIYLDDSTSASVVAATGSKSAKITDVPAGTHKVTVKAHVLNAYSTGVTVENITVYDAPKNVGVITIVKDYNAFTASWTDVGAYEYVVTVKDNSGDVVNLSSTNSKTDDVVSYQFTSVNPGKYTVSVVSKNEVGTESEASTTTVDVIGIEDAVLESDLISVEGFQIRINDTNENVAFRTVCKAPSVGQTITVGNQTYEIAGIGTIYALDTNTSGITANNQYDSTITILDETVVSGKKYQYVGKKNPNKTFGYITTPAALVPSLNTEGSLDSYYAITMEKMDGVLANSLHIRAFVVTTEGKIIYGKDAALTSVAEIASNMYTQSKAKNFTGHQYLYSILNSEEMKYAFGSVNNIYYRDTKVEYGWNNNIYRPGTSK